MGREEELIDRHDARDAIAAIDEDAEIARERAGIARHRHKLRHARFGESFGLRGGAGTRWVEHHGVIGLKLFRAERRTEEVAVEGPDRLELGRPPRGLGECGKRRLVGLVGIYG
jgi:hypothetical protein